MKLCVADLSISEYNSVFSKYSAREHIQRLTAIRAMYVVCHPESGVENVNLLLLIDGIYNQLLYQDQEHSITNVRHSQVQE